MSEDAREIVDKLKDREAENGYQVAQFYESRRMNESAIIYYEDIIKNYPDTQWAKKAQERLNEIKE